MTESASLGYRKQMNRENVSTAPSPRTDRTLSPRWTLFILTGLNLFNYLDRFVLPAVLPSIQKDLKINDEMAGWTGTAFMIGYFVTSPFFGYLGDRAARKWLIALGILIWSIGTVLTGFAQSLATLLLFRVLVGVGEASYATISPSYISDTFSKERRNNALTIFYVAIPVGAALGNIIGSRISAKYGWHTAFIWAGAPGLLLALCLLPFAEPRRGGADLDDGTTPSKPSAKDVLSLLRIPDYLLVVGGYSAYTFALGAFAHWAPSFLNRVHNVPLESAGTFFGAVLVVAGLLGTMLGGLAATAWQKRNRAGYAWTLGISVLTATPIAAAAFLVEGRLPAMGFLAAAIFLLFLSTGPVNTLIIEAVPVNLRSSAMAASIFFIHLLGDLPSPVIVGYFSKTWHSLQKAVMILPFALLVCALLWLALAIKTKRTASQRVFSPAQ